MKLLSIWKTFIAFSFQNLIAYRTDFLFRVGGMVINVLFMLVVLYLPFRYTQSLAGWSQDEVLIVLGMYYIMNGLSWTFFKEGIFKLDQKIRNGSLDFALLKPENSQFLMTFFDVDLTRIADVLVGLVIIVIQIVSNDVALSVSSLLFTLIAMLAGLIAIYALYLTVNILSFWTGEAYLGHVANPLFTIAKYPTSVWGERVALLFFWVLPVALLSTVPSAVLLDKVSTNVVAAAVVISIVWIAISAVCWKIGVTRYTRIAE